MSLLASTSLTASTRYLNRQDYKTLFLAALGATLELYDFVIFLFLLTELRELFFPPNMPIWLAQIQALGIFAAGFLVRPVSGIIFAHFGDKFGRKRMFALSIFLMALPTLCIGLLPTYATIGIAAPLLLLTMRIMQGAAIGGEVPGAWVFIAEHVPARHMGLGLGILTCGISGGSLLGALVVLNINTHFSVQEVHDFAWRIPFILGGIFGLISVYLRKFLSETPVFKEIAAKRKLSKDFPIKTVLREHQPALVLSIIMTWTTSAVVFVIILLPPTLLLEAYNIPKALIFKANALATIMMIAGNITLGWLSDRFGSRFAFIFCWTGVTATGYYFFTHLSGIAEQAFIVNYMFLGFFAGATVTMPIVSVRAFPSAVRFTGVSFAYNITFCTAGILTPLLITTWANHHALAPAHYLLIVSACSIVAGCTTLARKGYNYTQNLP